jgi:hypothetical protein
MSARHGFAVRPQIASHWLYAFAAIAILTAAGCTGQSARFYTELSQPGRLAGGSPVYNFGSSIGSVASVNRLADGNSGVAFDVNRADASAIRRDSIMVLHDDPAGASLDVMNADPSSPPASPGTQIDGASNQNDANMLIAAKNVAATAPAIAMMLSATGSGGAASVNTSPAWLLLQQQMIALQSQYLMAGMRNATVAAQQLQQITQNAAALERQLLAAGHSAEAERLRRQIEALSRALTTPPAGMTPSFGAPPASGATPPAATPPSTLVIPPAR